MPRRRAPPHPRPRNQPLLELHARTAPELAYALEYARDAGDIGQIVARAIRAPVRSRHGLLSARCR